MFRASVLALLFFLVVPFSAAGAPPGTVVCDNPLVQPSLIVHWAPISADAVEHAAFDSTHIFTHGVLSGNIVRFTLNAEDQEAWTVTDLEGPAHFAICPTTEQLYVNDLDLNQSFYDHRLWVFDPNGNGTPTDILFTGPSSMAPGGLVYGPLMFAFHPTTGSLYVFDQGSYNDGGDEVWVSRIQRFSPSGSYEGFVINNALGHHPDTEPMPYLPPCGAWRWLDWLFVDRAGNIYLTDYNGLGDPVPAVQKFTSTGTCVGVWDLASHNGDSIRFAVDPDGYFYTFEGNTLRKWTNGFGQLVYERAMEGPVHGIRFMPGSSEFMLTMSNIGTDRRVELFGPQIEPLNIIGQDWQDTSPPYQLNVDDLNALTICDGSRQSMAGVAADGVSPLLLRWKAPGPGTFEWKLVDVDYPSVTSLLGTLASLDSAEVDTLTIEVPIEKVGDDYYAFAVYTGPVNFDRVGILQDNVEKRLILVEGYFRSPSTQGLYNAAFPAVPIQIMRPPVLLVHGLWDKAETWGNFESNTGVNFPGYRVNYSNFNGQGLTYHEDVGTINKKIRGARLQFDDSLIVVAQVDAVMHSMGGLLVRKHADSPGYKNAQNLGHGDFHKLLFLDTPHQGSPLANIMTEMRETATSWLTRPTRRAAAWLGMQAIAIMRGTTFEQIAGSAIDDLRTGSQAIAGLKEVNVPTYAHVGPSRSRPLA